MKERMQKIPMSSDSRPQKDSTECESYEGLQTFMDITENNLKEVQFEQGDLLEFILSPENLNRTYLQVKRNHGSGGVDGLSTRQLGDYLKEHKDELIASLQSGRYRPNPVLRIEIPKDNGQKRPLGIPTVVDRVIQQAISQILSPIYERQFSDNSFGFRPHRSCHKALRRAQKYITQGYKYCVSLELERFFDTVNHSMLIRILSRTIRDGRVLSLIHKYLTAGVMFKPKVIPALWTYMSNCIRTKEPPYAERHVRWCERSENESRKKTTSFSSYSITLIRPFTPHASKSVKAFTPLHGFSVKPSQP